MACIISHIIGTNPLNSKQFLLSNDHTFRQGENNNVFLTICRRLMVLQVLRIIGALNINVTAAEQTQSASEDHVVLAKTPEQVIN